MAHQGHPGSSAGSRTRTPLVGREQELAALRAALAHVAGGSPSAVLITGPTGIGKTRLAQEARALAVDAGLGTFASRADDLSREVAYAPVAAAFGPLLRDLDAAERTGLVGDLPQLGLVFSGLGLPPPTPFTEPELRRVTLLDGLTRVLDRLSRRTPLLWVLDDVHAADTETRRLLAHLAAALPDRPTLLLLTARDDEPAVDHVHALARAFAESPWRLTRLEPAPLDDEDAARLAGSVLDQPLDEELARAVVTRGVGRPLFLESLSQTLKDSGRLEVDAGRLTLRDSDLPLPAGIHQHLRARLTPLEHHDRAVLEVVAICGSPVEHDVLAEVCRLPARPLGESLTRLQRRRLVVRAADLGYDVAHGLLRDTVLADLAPTTVASVHADLARARSADGREDHRVAEHVLRAGSLLDREVAAGLLVDAAGHARLVGATPEARRYLDAAVALLDGARQRRSDGRLALADLLTDLGELATQLGDYAAARQRWRAAIEEQRADGRSEGLARTHRMLGLLEWTLGDLQAAEQRFDTAENVLEGLEPGPELGELLLTRMVAANRVGDLAALDRLSSQMRQLADRIGSPELAVRAHLGAAMAAYGRTDYARMATDNRLALEAAADVEDAELLLRVHDQLSVGAGCGADLAALRRHSLESLRIAQEAGAPSWEPWPRVRLAYAALLSGDLDAGLRGTSEVLGYVDRFPQPRGEASLCASHALMLAHAGRLKEARSYLDRALSTASPALRQDRNIYTVVANAAVVVALAEGRAEEARRAGAPLAAMAGGWLPLLGTATYGEACAACGDAAAAEQVAARLRDVVSCDTALPEVLADWVAGLAARAQDQGAGGDLLAQAHDGFDRLGLRVHATRAALELARARCGPEPGEAVAHARSALAGFEEMGMPQHALAARELLRSLGVTPSRGRARSAGDGPLSARELEVARLVAAGLTNAEVATELFISPRTVSTHLDRIYARLGLSSRAALTRYLADSGLLAASVT